MVAPASSDYAAGTSCSEHDDEHDEQHEQDGQHENALAGPQKTLGSGACSIQLREFVYLAAPICAASAAMQWLQHAMRIESSCTYMP